MKQFIFATFFILVGISINANTAVKREIGFERSSSVPSISILNPSPDQIWYIGNNEGIKWSTTDLQDTHVNIQLSTDNGNTWQMIDSNYLYTGNVRGITVPNVITDQAKIKISATADPTVNSTVNIKIHKSTAVILSINNGEELTGCMTKEIRWTQEGFGSMVIFDYSVDDGKLWRHIGVGYETGDTSSYPWLVPNISSKDVRIRVRDYQNNPLADVSPLHFSIKGDSSTTIAIVSPHAGESFSANSVHPIYWNNKGTVGNVDIQASFDGGAHFYYIKDINGKDGFNVANTGFYNWLIDKNVNPSSNYIIQIYDFNNHCIIGYSDTFSIHNNSNIQILHPVEKEVLYTGRPYTIKWLYSYLPSDYVNIESSLDNGVTWTMIDSNFYYFNEYKWTVPNKLTNKGILRISATADPSVNDTIKFEIGTPAIALTSLTGGETLTACTSTKINWNYGGTSSYSNLDYSLNEGMNWISFAKAPQTIGANSYDWKVPAIESSKIRIRIRDVEYPSVKDSSTANITIVTSIMQKSIILNTFSVAESISRSSLTPIRWSNVNTVGNVSLQYSLDRGLTWSFIQDRYTFKADNIPNKGVYYWYLPKDFPLSSNCLIRIYEYNEPCVIDYNDTPFTINDSSSIAIVRPDPDTVYYVGRKYTIEWTSNHLPTAFVNIDYSIDNGVNWIQLASNFPDNSYYTWKIAKQITNEGLLRVRATANSSIQNIIPFKIMNSSIQLINPVGGEIFHSCTTVIGITWKKIGGSFGSNIDYSLDGGENWIFYAHTNDFNDTMSYLFGIPTVNSKQVRFRVRDDDNDWLKDSTRKDLTIVTTDSIHLLQLYYPNGGESFSAGSVKVITWRTTGNISDVSLSYSLDGGLTWSYLETYGGVTAKYIPNFSSVNYFDWLVPANLPLSSKGLIKLADANGGCILDFNDHFFSIDHNPTITLTNPLEGDSVYVGKTIPVEWLKAHLASESVAVEYSTDKGANWTLIDSSTVTTCGWIVPNKVTTEGQLRARSLSDNTINSQINLKILNSLITAVDLNTIENNWNIYPNPATDAISIDYSITNKTNFSVLLINANGQVVYTESHQQYSGPYTKKIDLHEKQPGVYLLQIITDEGIVTRKVIKN